MMLLKLNFCFVLPKKKSDESVIKFLNSCKLKNKKHVSIIINSTRIKIISFFYHNF
jgi:hypothetical protein